MMKRLIGLLMLVHALPVYAQWHGDGELSFDFNRGNSRSDAWRAEFDLEGRFDRDHYLLELDGRKERSGGGGERMRLSSERYLVSPKYERWDAADRFYAFIDPEARYNRFSDLQRQDTLLVGAGGGGNLLGDGRLKVEFGLGYRRSIHSEGAPISSPIFVLRNQLNYPISSNVSFAQSLSLVSGRDADAAELGLTLKSHVSERVSLRLRVSWEYNWPVPAGSHRLNTDSRLALGYEF